MFHKQVYLARSRGTVVVAANADVGVTGESATGCRFSPVTGTANVAASRSAGTGAVGSPTISSDAIVPEAGISATGGVGSVTVAAEADGGLRDLRVRVRLIQSLYRAQRMYANGYFSHRWRW